MNRAQEKAQRLLQIERLLWAHPEGRTRAEIARALGVNRSTITKYLAHDQLPPSVYEDDLDGQKLKLDRSADLTRASFTLHEIMAIHLATRLLATRSDKQNPHAASALRKLGLALQRLDQNVSGHLLRSADVMDEEASHRDPVYLDVLEKLTEAWSAGRKVRLSHQMDDLRIFEYTFSPYFIEPYAVGQTTHVIGWREPPGARRTFKIERIRSAQILPDRYEIPSDFDPGALLRDAWGIWYSDAEPTEVVLRFHPRVALRVRETQWHTSQRIEEMPDGSLLLRVRVAEPREMVPWVRGWGADCEVLEPEGLRRALRREAQQLAEVYEVVEKKNRLLAHIRKSDKETQALEDHLTGVSRLAGQFADKLGLKEAGEVLGLLHDLGKASRQFQNYLLSGEGFKDPDADGYIDPDAMRGKIDHSTAGAQLVCETLWPKGAKEKAGAQVLALCLASHHSGLIDCLAPEGEDNFRRRMGKSDENTHKAEAIANLREIRSAFEGILSRGVVDQIIAKVTSLHRDGGNESQTTLMFKAGLLIRYLLSCLLDADRLDTADFEAPGNSRIRNYGNYHSWSVLAGRLEKKFAEFAAKTQDTHLSQAVTVNQLRSQVAQACLDAAMKPRGIYQLTVPTGGGKTFASLRLALNHAKHHAMDRVFYVIPYTSIIDQNADEVRKILEDRDANGSYLDQVVLEHHSNLTPEEESRRHSLLAENWDAPVVFTTQVQFLEALFGAGTRSARRMHQLANSVVILDEVQTIPINMIHMLNVALRFLVDDCGATAVLCTATQPPLDKVGTRYRELTILPDRRIIQNEQELFEKLRRVQVFEGRKVGGWRVEEVAELAERQLCEKGCVLAIVNTKKSAHALYDAIKGRQIAEARTYHLSTSMCPAHRMDVLREIKDRLAREEPVICVSTQLIEAGVDIDFGAVIRYLAGLDSIAQAAGRCNRHGERPGLGNVWIVNPADENLAQLKDILEGSDVANRVLDDFAEEPEAFDHDRIGLEAMAAYYRFYYARRKDEMNYPVTSASAVGRDDDLFNLLSLNILSAESYQRRQRAKPELEFKQSFQTAAREFRVIDSVTQGVVVPYAGGEEIINELRCAPELEKEYKLLKRAQRYSVNLFAHEFKRLAKARVIQEVQEGAGVYYLDEQYYSQDFGWSEEIVSDMQFHCV